MEMKLTKAFLLVCFLPCLLCSQTTNEDTPETWWERYVRFLKFYGEDHPSVPVIDIPTPPGPPGPPQPPQPPELPDLPDPPTALPTAKPEFPELNISIPISDIRCIEYNWTRFEFTCDYIAPSPIVPRSVHSLRPGDINVVAALGDSLTAGNGARADCLIEVIIMGRELSFSIGGNATIYDGIVTLPNILKTYNPNLKGYSLAAGPDFSLERSSLNVAVPGARSDDMLVQTQEMIHRMKTWGEVDWYNDWKMVTLFIGGNDLCACKENVIGPDEYAYNIKLALDLMHKEMPRTFVNLVQVVQVTELNQMTSTFCNIAHKIACECAKELWNEDWEEIYNLTQAYYRAIDNLILYGQYDTRDDFTVVIQPFFEESEIKENDPNFLSPDCFHFSEYGHQVSAMELWNNLIEPAGEKRKSWSYDDVIECPTNDYFYTYMNTPGYVAPTRGPTSPQPTQLPTSPTPAPTYNFTCPYIPPSNQIPTSVHELRPGDVKVLAALGDSITAGFNILSETFRDLGQQFRGWSWSIGGEDSYEEGTLTLTNILRNYNQDIKGYSLGTGPHTNYTMSRLNMAIGGARARHMLAQTEDMIDRMKTWDDVDFENDWKVVTLFIGGNDLCAYDRDREGSTAEVYKAEIKEALDLMHAEMPRTFVNLVQVLLVTEINKLDGYCDYLHWLACRPAKARWDENWTQVLDLAHEYHRALEDLVLYGDYDTRDDFTVVIQPFFEETHIPWLEDEQKWDDSLFSPDCFHFSEEGHQLCAMSLWNNMIEPAGAKRTAWLPEDVIECPPVDFEYFYTYKNTPGYVTPTRGPTEEPPTTPARQTPEPTYNFTCPYLPPSNQVPTSVHELRPGDVKVLAALGDSITAGFNILSETFRELGEQFRGWSWSIGGEGVYEEGTLTLTNILRKYNPDVKGYSIGTGSHTNYNISRLNVAVGGARAKNMLEQTEDMIDRMKTWDGVDWDNDWKVVTLFIGGNDLCAYDRDREGSTAAVYQTEIKKALDLMHAEMPRTFVNLVQVLLVTEINKLEGYCDLIHLAACRPAKERWDENWEEVLDLTHAYHRALEDLVLYGDYDTRDDFTVVIQPFYEETYIPWLEEEGKWDDSLFSPDCFHFSEYGHQISAMSLWNNMIEPVGEKRTGWVPEDVVECPPEDFEYFYTYMNTPGYVPPTRGPTTLPPSTEEPTQPYKFACEITAPSNEIPTSAHRLRPADVKVIAALGDSITAANGAGADNLLQVAIQYRGLSYSIGGDETLNDGVLTLSNVLRMYNPDLKGYSTDTGPDSNLENSKLNVAVPGARARHMYEQTEEMITRMKDWEEVDYDNDWKVVTLFIGGNDLCACSNYSAVEYAAEIEKALDLMHQEMPRTFVNLAQVVVVTELNKLDEGFCDTLHLAYCSCAKEIYNENWEKVLDLTHAYHQALRDLVATGKYDTREDFTVVLQPFFEETYIPWNEETGDWDDSMFSPDCFHFSEYGHQMCAMSLWNNMIEPVGEKRKGWTEDDILECPHEGFEYFYTNLNSPGNPSARPVTTTEAVKPQTTMAAEEPVSADPACTDYTVAFITAILICIVLLIVCICGIIYLVYKVSSMSSKSNTYF